MSGFSLPPLDIPALLKEYNLRPSKGLGQNFLRDNQELQKVVNAAEPNMDDSVLEVGAGLGSLTRYLALAVKSVVAVELDTRLFSALKTTLAPYNNIRLVQGDILKLDPAELMDTPDYLVVANIPYYITSAIIRHLLESNPKPRRVVLTIQQEVAERICALPGEMSLLALSVQVYGRPQIKADIPAGAFYPSPKVDSCVLCVDIYSEPVIPVPQMETFFSLARAGFSQKRKTLRNSISAGMRIPPGDAQERLAAAGIDPQRRAETLDLEEWKKLSGIFWGGGTG